MMGDSDCSSYISQNDKGSGSDSDNSDEEIKSQSSAKNNINTDDDGFETVS